MLDVVKNRLLRGKQFGVGAERFSAIRIAVEAREVAAGNFKPDAMAALEKIAGHP